ncbi:helix-turn-helix domain-containing protein [Metabacillus indicus]|uniref:helix-turn-helix domain-containing protein n=1 Tax=Metabacillus indicus TaxID=246786 RepID=UPI0038783B21
MREERGVPIGYLANALGISVSTLMSIERGKQHMNKDQLQFICEIYNVKKSDLIAKSKP